MKKHTMSNCPVENALKLIGGKWKIPIIHHLSKKKLRFGQIKKLLNQITQQMLSKQLKEMEIDGLINRRVHSIVPPKVEYSLTDFGKSVLPILDSLYSWSVKKNKVITKLVSKNHSDAA
jgi:DNA-binding HxlR family transcriptional regulator